MNEHKRLQNEIVEIITKNITEGHYRVFFFGSRVDGSASERSDIDIGVEASDKVPTEVMFEIKDGLDRIRTLHKLDLVDFSEVDDSFKRVALENIEVIYEQ